MNSKETTQQQTRQTILQNQYKPLKNIDEFHETKKSIYYSLARQIATEEKSQEVLRPAQKGEPQNAQSPMTRIFSESESIEVRNGAENPKDLVVDSQVRVFYIGAFYVWDQQALQNSEFSLFTFNSLQSNLQF